MPITTSQAAILRTLYVMAEIQAPGGAVVGETAMLRNIVPLPLILTTAVIPMPLVRRSDLTPSRPGCEVVYRMAPEWDASAHDLAGVTATVRAALNLDPLTTAAATPGSVGIVRAVPG